METVASGIQTGVDFSEGVGEVGLEISKQHRVRSGDFAGVEHDVQVDRSVPGRQKQRCMVLSTQTANI